MATKKPKSPNERAPQGGAGLLSGKAAKITGGIALLAALATQVEQISTGVAKLWQRLSPPVVEACFTPKIAIEPVTVALKNWPRVQFRMTGRNTCKQKLEVHVAYKTPLWETIYLEPPYKRTEQACIGYDNPECWEQNSIEGGASIDWVLTPPRLRPMAALPNPVTVGVNWIVFNTETRKQVHAGKTQITMKND